jgi:hypothetical protein
MESKKEDNNRGNINKSLRSYGFLFPSTETELEEFDKLNSNFQYELIGNEIDPMAIYSNRFSEVEFKLTKKNGKISSSGKPRPFDYYKRSLLAAEIVFQLQKEPTLGHLKLQKLIYLCEQSSSMSLPTNFLKQAMGPYDSQLMRSIDIQLEKKNWFKYMKDEFLKYQPLKNAGSHKMDYEKYLSNEAENIDYLIDMFRDSKSNFIELIATVFACRIDVITKHEIFSENLILNKFFKWSKEKSKFSKTDVFEALEWMDEKGLTPQNI